MASFGILYLDDSPMQLDAFRQSLEGSDYTLWTAQNPAEAQRVLRSAQVDLTVVDYHIGETTGAACLPQLKQVARPGTRFYLYTVDPEAFRRHREMGFDGVLMLKGKSSVRTQIDVVARSLMRVREA